MSARMEMVVRRPLNPHLVTEDEARAAGMLGWNLRCNRCGSFGAEWMAGERPGWGSYAACPSHAAEIRDEHRRHEKALRELRVVNFHQPHRKSPRYVYE